jgi:hypothetical protein
MNEKKRRNIVARVLGAENKTEAVAAEAKRAGVSTRTIERWVEAAKGTSGGVGQDVVSENVPPAEKSAENPVLDKLLNEDGKAGKPAGGAPTLEDYQQAEADAARFCVEAYAGPRAAVGAVLVAMRYSPILDASSPEVQRLLKVTTAAELAIRMNAPRIYPILVRYASGWGPLVLAIGADAIGMLIGLESLAKSRGWAPAPKKATDRPNPASVPTAKEYGEQLNPEPSAATDPKAAAVAATIVDAPLPTEEHVEEYKRLAALRAAGIRVG